MSKGRPVYAIMLLRSDVRRDIGFDSVGALDANGGEPQSSSVCSSPCDIVKTTRNIQQSICTPGNSDTSEYWYVQSFSTG